MAKTTDTSAQKQRQQKIILAVLGVVLLALVALQGPKLLKGNDSSTPEAAPAAGDGSTLAPGTTILPGTVTGGTATTPAATTTAGSTTQTTTVPAGVPRAVLVGVPVGAGAKVVAGEGQLRSFTLFTQKDPFVQLLPPETSATAAPAEGPTKGSAPGATGGTTSGGAATAEPEAQLAYATISVNAEAEPVTLKQPFPQEEKLFVLKALKPKSAKIAVNGGEFTDGQTLTLKLGKDLTLVNTATGARYTLKLLYVGDQPEQVEGFVTKPAKASGVPAEAPADAAK